MRRLLIISNRLPVTITKKEGNLKFLPSIGGLATGLESFYKSYKSLWVGWPGITLKRLKEKKDELKKRLTAENCHPVFLSHSDIENYYYGFCNKTIWPLFHYFTQRTIYGKNLWKSYQRVNELFCNEVAKITEQDDTIWIHDYHLMLLPKMLRDKLPEATIGFFLHIPFPSFEVFRLLPCRKEILDGLMGADLIGFHTYDYAQHFIDSVRRLLGYEFTMGQITTGNRILKVDAFPMGIDYEQFISAIHKPRVQKEIKKIHKKIGERKIILSVDRLDYTKGIPERLEAFDLFLEKNPQYREKVTLILVAVPSRTGVEHYMLLKKQVDELISRINGKYGTIGWIPIWYLYRFLPFNNLISLYNTADVALVTPLRDGMNLIAKEFIASKANKTGVLILSEMAGAAKELGEAIIVNPNNKEEIAEAIKTALKITDKEMIKNNQVMQRRLERYNIVRWAQDFMDRLYHIKKIQQDLCTRRLTEKIRKKLINAYKKAKLRLILLDYDGTLVPFADDPEKAMPDNKLLKILRMLTAKPDTEVVIISGRNKKVLDRYFKNLNLGLIAEHGVWIKEKSGVWELLEPLKNDWKDQIRPILELYVDRTPGSFIEEKEYSLVWHYRKADSQLVLLRLGELKDALLHLTANLNLGVLEGSKVIEIKNIGINKGRAALRWISKRDWDFIIAIGDDWTDEDLFSVLPNSAYSIKVGLGITQARFNIAEPSQVRQLLKQIGGKGG